jgi:hypothetical protein
MEMQILRIRLGYLLSTFAGLGRFSRSAERHMTDQAVQHASSVLTAA